MAGKPICRDCGQEMIAAKGFNALLAFHPPQELDSERFTPVSLYVCGKCGQIRMYHASPAQWERAKVEMVSYGYRITGQEENRSSKDGAGSDDGEFEPRRSKA